MITARDVQDLLNERPDLEPAVQAAYAADPPWTFEDIEVDSGRFGEFVSTDLVEAARDGDGYRLANAAAVETALADEPLNSSLPADDTDNVIVSRARRLYIVFTQPTVRIRVGALLAALGLVAVLRMSSGPAVFRGSEIVLSGNDPYYYRYLVEQVLTEPEVTLTTLPPQAATGEPLLVVTLSLGAYILGGTPTAAGHVLAWYPVVSAVGTALLLYMLTTWLTADRRVALAAVAMLAVMPGHAMRTSLGFADHHAFDYVWIAVTLAGFVLILAHERRQLSYPRGVGAVVCALGIAGSVLAWEAGPLMILPVGLVGFGLTLHASAIDGPDWTEVGLVALATLLAAGIVWVAHLTLGWHSTVVALAPTILAVGLAGMGGLSVFWHRRGLPTAGLGVAQLGLLVAVALILRTAQPALWTRLTTGITDRLLAGRSIAEVQSLFGESVGWLLLFGFLLFLAVPYLAWTTLRLRTDRKWLPIVAYGWAFLVLAAVQVRFAGQLSIVLAVTAGLGFVHLATRVLDIQPPQPLRADTTPNRRDTDTAPDQLQPTRRQTVVTGLLFLLVTSLSLIQTPTKTQQLTISTAQYETMRSIDAYADAHQLEYPDNYVLSAWGNNRFYNYFVNGQARSYGYARANYSQFLAATDPDQWYDRLQGRVGFVVTTDAGVTTSDALGTRLHTAHGSRTPDTPGLAHYLLVGVSADRSHKAFAVVPGAVIQGSAAPNSVVELQTEVVVDGLRVTYTRQTTADADGGYQLRVAYPGLYRGTTQQIRVTEAAVRAGKTLTPE